MNGQRSPRGSWPDEVRRARPRQPAPPALGQRRSRDRPHWPGRSSGQGAKPMKLFAVRTIEGQQPVGFFWVRNLLGLLIAVDNFHDPDACEYKPIRREAAIVWPELGQWQMGVDVQLADPNCGGRAMPSASWSASISMEHSTSSSRASSSNDGPPSSPPSQPPRNTHDSTFVIPSADACDPPSAISTFTGRPTAPSCSLRRQRSAIVRRSFSKAVTDDLAKWIAR